MSVVTKPTRPTNWAIGSALVVALCAGAFSFRSTHDVTVALGIGGDLWSWLMPCSLEAAAVSVTLLIHARGRSGATVEWLTLFAMIALVAWVQVAHVTGWGLDALRPVLAVAPFAVLAVLVHLLLRTHEAAVEAAAPKRNPKTPKASPKRPSAERATIERSLSSAEAKPSAGTPSARRPLHAVSERSTEPDWEALTAEEKEVAWRSLSSEAKRAKAQALVAERGESAQGKTLIERFGAAESSARNLVRDAKKALLTESSA